jgi:hypothetical protein
MPKITNPVVLQVLRDPYFDHHTIMHLARERVPLAGGHQARLILDPAVKCKECENMIPAGEPGSGEEFLQMHHEMIRVFRKLLKDHGIELAVQWADDHWGKPSLPDDAAVYRPTVWDLDDYRLLPQEIRGMFSETDPQYLSLVFAGVHDRIAEDKKDPVDELGRFIERGVETGEEVRGEGFHNTMHDYLGSREGKAATGAEMNKLRSSMFNDYFWSLHLWIDAQYGRLLQHLNQPFDTSPLYPEMAMGTKPGRHAMKMSAGIMKMSADTMKP